jgi:hypothetical protein
MEQQTNKIKNWLKNLLGNKFIDIRTYHQFKKNGVLCFY